MSKKKSNSKRYACSVKDEIKDPIAQVYLAKRKVDMVLTKLSDALVWGGEDVPGLMIKANSALVSLQKRWQFIHKDFFTNFPTQEDWHEFQWPTH